MRIWQNVDAFRANNALTGNALVQQRGLRAFIVVGFLFPKIGSHFFEKCSEWRAIIAMCFCRLFRIFRQLQPMQASQEVD